MLGEEATSVRQSKRAGLERRANSQSTSWTMRLTTTCNASSPGLSLSLAHDDVDSTLNGTTLLGGIQKSVGDEGSATVCLVRDGEWVRFVIRFEILDVDRFREMAGAMVAVSRDDLGAPTTWWGAPIAAVTDAG